MKLGISKPRRQEYRPRPIDGKATKAARTRHAAGVKRLQRLFFGAQPIPAPGQRRNVGVGRYRCHGETKAARRARDKAQRQARKANR